VLGFEKFETLSKILEDNFRLTKLRKKNFQSQIFRKLKFVQILEIIRIFSVNFD
jgi:hypothetical protein